MPVAMVTASGEQHGLINTLTNSVKANGFKHMDPKDKTAIEKEYANDSRIVKAEYMNSRGPHERLTKPYCKYAGDPIQIWHFIPGRVYDVPVGLINEVNETSKKMKRRAGLVSVDGASVNGGQPLAQDQEGEWLHKFVPVAF